MKDKGVAFNVLRYFKIIDIMNYQAILTMRLIHTCACSTIVFEFKPWATGANISAFRVQARILLSTLV